MPHRRALLLLLAVTACEHSQPAEPSIPVVDTLPDDGPPPRLTLNEEMDLTPAFTVDGHHLWYSWERNDQVDQDLCLGLIPVAGGQRSRETCPVAAGSIGDSANWFISPAPHPDGRRVAWYQLSSLYQGRGSSGEIVIGPVDGTNDPSRVIGLQHFPIHAPSGRTHVMPEQLQWADDSTLVYLGVLVTTNDTLAAQDTFYSGLEIAKLTLVGDTATLASIPGTGLASGVAVAAGGKIVFTRNGDPRIYRTTLNGGPVETIHDFGNISNFARDPVLAGDTIYAIVGGEISYGTYPIVGPLQLDKGGALWRGHAHVSTLISSERLFRHPSISPDHRTVALEGRDPITRIQDIFLVNVGGGRPLHPYAAPSRLTQ